jgi:L-2-hydroxycarboxylate dehydrogenase (NAD+)
MSTDDVDAGELTVFVTRALSACGMATQDAGVVAAAMIDADLAGVDTHGAFRLEQYVDGLLAGDIDPRAEVTMDRTAASVVLLDAGGGMGHVAMHRASEVAIELARTAGTAWIGIRRSNHAGAIGVYAERLAAAGMIGICGAVSGINHMAPTGAAEALLGTNPLAMAFPAGLEPPIVIDFATSNASFGKIKAAAANGASMPEGWAIERSTGRTLTDPRRIEEGLLLPSGEHKGIALSLAIGLLAGVLNDASFGREIPDFADHSFALKPETGQFVLAIDIAVFGSADAFRRDVDRHIGDFLESRLLPNASQVRIPGRNRSRIRAERLRSGIPLGTPTLLSLSRIARRLEIEPCFTIPPA